MEHENVNFKISGSNSKWNILNDILKKKVENFVHCEKVETDE